MKHANEALDAVTGGRLLALMQACAAGCADAEAFRSLLQRHLQPLIPHSHAVALLANVAPSLLSVERMVVCRDARATLHSRCRGSFSFASAQPCRRG